MDRDSYVCLSRVRHMVMLHGRVSPGVSFDFKSVYPTGLTLPKHTGVFTGHVSGKQAGTRAYGYPCDPSQFRPWPRHTGMSSAVWSKSVCMPCFATV
ncbi:CinA-like protein [Gossypium arboreum]|uniref:CinA-like protein n=1 Tax=Gossypium arboreum TaxID=29729 RepID=A0A0B0MUE7_GOSAR|nr:CinA-like protein [Gossypium arboreum]